jgi:hypothetical protein
MTNRHRERIHEVERLLAAVPGWASGQPDVRAAALVGSWARGTAGAHSDVDMILLTDQPEIYIESDVWLPALGGAEIIRTRRWGKLTERRVVGPSGLEIDVGIATPAWASTSPVDAGTANVVADGLVSLHDPDGLLHALVAAVRARGRSPAGHVEDGDAKQQS